MRRREKKKKKLKKYGNSGTASSVAVAENGRMLKVEGRGKGREGISALSIHPFRSPEGQCLPEGLFSVAILGMANHPFWAKERWWPRNSFWI